MEALFQWPLLPLALGIIFGWLLNRGGVTQYNVIVRQFLFEDFTVLKIMLTAMIVGGIGVYALVQAGYATYHIKPAALVAVGVGAGIFGVGMAIYGYCPGTALAAMATGSLHAAVGVLGMLLGALVYAAAFDFITLHIMPLYNMGNVRLPDITGVPDRVWFIGLAAIAAPLFYALHKKGL